jgi:hypothetical protein
LLPIWVAGLLIEYHRHGELSLHWWKVQAWLMLPCFALAFWYNQWAVRKKLQPQLDRLLALRREWSGLASDATPAPGSETPTT